jgi:hypothetical protein
MDAQDEKEAKAKAAASSSSSSSAPDPLDIVDEQDFTAVVESPVRQPSPVVEKDSSATCMSSTEATRVRQEEVARAAALQQAPVAPATVLPIAPNQIPAGVAAAPDLTAVLQCFMEQMAQAERRAAADRAAQERNNSLMETRLKAQQEESARNHVLLLEQIRVQSQSTRIVVSQGGTLPILSSDKYSAICAFETACKQQAEAQGAEWTTKKRNSCINDNILAGIAINLKSFVPDSEVCDLNDHDFFLVWKQSLKNEHTATKELETYETFLETHPLSFTGKDVINAENFVKAFAALRTVRNCVSILVSSCMCVFTKWYTSRTSVHHHRVSSECGIRVMLYLLYFISVIYSTCCA